MSILSHIQESKAEMKHVKWPSQAQVISYTTIVIVFSIFIALYIAGLDAVFAKGLAWLISVAQR